MSTRILVIAVEQEKDIVLARQRTRVIAEHLGFDLQDQTRITTAVSEIVRNTLEYGKGGRIDYRIDSRDGLQSLLITVADQGPGIANAEEILHGLHRSTTGMGIGIRGARRLMDEFAIETSPGRGTSIRMAKRLPRGVAISAARIGKIGEMLAKDDAPDALAEIRRQNQEMVAQLEESIKRQQQLAVLNQELQDTNRGVVALYAELNDRADHLRQADELKSRFLSNMSHEFRTPLNSILALARLLLSRNDGELSAEQEKQVQYICKAAENLTEMVNDLLDLAKVEAGKTVVAPVEFSITDLFSTLRGMLRPLLVGDAVSLVFDAPVAMPVLCTDESKVSQILRNFISNALKFTERGEVRVAAEFDAACDSVTFRVSDTGIGIAEADMEIIWQEFGQVSHPVQTRVKGTGLGLPLSKKLAELLLGRVGVESEPGKGSTFWLTLPRVFPRYAGDVDAELAWVPDPSRLPILLVEDNPADRLVYERIFENGRYQLMPTTSTAQARRALGRIMPAVVILDVLLEGEETWRFLIDTKHNEATHRIPFLVVTNTKDERKARNLGADAYLDKPADPQRLVRLLDELSGERPTVRVLMVDDEEISRYLVRQLLPRARFYLHEATTAMEGLMLTREVEPDVIILDLNMAPVDGFGFLSLLSENAKKINPAVVVLTSLILDDAQRKKLSAATAILSKSDLTTGMLVGAIERARELRGADQP